MTTKDGSGTTAVCNINVKAAAVKLNASKAPLQVKKSSAALKVGIQNQDSHNFIYGRILYKGQRNDILDY